MNLKKDAYGQEILAYLAGKEFSEVVERDDGFIGLSGGAPASWELESGLEIILVTGLIISWSLKKKWKIF